MTQLIKQPKNAAATARLLSRILRDNGFERADTSDRYRWTEGFHVNRVGFSSSVHVDYHTNLHETNEERIRRHSKVAQMREVLFELGYISTHPHAIYIECQSP